MRFVPKFSRLLLGKTSPTGDRCGPARYTAQKKKIHTEQVAIHVHVMSIPFNYHIKVNLLRQQDNVAADVLGIEQ